MSLTPFRLGVKNNFKATVPPTEADDVTRGWSVGSRWIISELRQEWSCRDNSENDAQWEQLEGGGATRIIQEDPDETYDDTQGYVQGSVALNEVTSVLWVCLDPTENYADWITFSNLAHMHPYLVGPEALAPYQTIQDAADAIKAAAPADPFNVIFILPGVYSGDVTITDYSTSLVAAVPKYRRDLPNVTIIGTITLVQVSDTSGGINMTDISMQPPSGQSCMAFTGTATQLLYLTNCRFIVSGANMFDFSGATASAEPYFTLGTKGCMMGLTLATDRIATPNKPVKLALDESLVFNFGAYYGDVTVIEMNDPNAYLQTRGNDVDVTVAGKVLVNNASRLNLHNTQFINDPSGAGYHIEVNVALNDPTHATAPSYIDKRYIGENIKIGGTQFATLKEVPFTDDGSFLQYDAAEWQGVQVAAATTAFLVGPAGTAKYTDIQAAIDAASSGDEVLVLGGTYVGDIVPKDGVYIRALASYADTVNDVIIQGSILPDPNANTTCTIVGVQIAPPSGSVGVRLAPAASKYHNMSFRSCRIYTTDAIGIEIAKGSGLFVGANLNNVDTIRAYSSVTGPAVDINNGNFVLNEGRITGNIGSNTEALDLRGGSLVTVEGSNDLNDILFGNIHVSSGTGNILKMRRTAILVNSGDHVTVDGSLSSSWYYDVVDGGTSEPITVGGTNASQFKETPTATAGDIRQYDGDRWQNVAATSVGGRLTKLDGKWVALATSGDGSKASSSTVTGGPILAVKVFVNGAEVYLADGPSEKTTSVCYFSGDSGITARAADAVQAGDELYWNGSVAGYELAVTDRIALLYEV